MRTIFFLLLALSVSGLCCPAWSAQDAEAIIARGEELSSQTRYADAVKVFSLGIEKHPSNSELFRRRAICLFKLGKYRQSLDDFNKAVNLDPQSSQALLGRGSAKRMLKDFPGAANDYEAALGLDPHYAAAYVNRGSLRLDLLMFSEAEADYRKALELENGNVLACLGLGLVRLKVKDYQGAAGYYARALSLEPGNVEARSKLDMLARQFGASPPKAQAAPTPDSPGRQTGQEPGHLSAASPAIAGPADTSPPPLSRSSAPDPTSSGTYAEAGSSAGPGPSEAALAPSTGQSSPPAETARLQPAPASDFSGQWLDDVGTTWTFAPLTGDRYRASSQGPLEAEGEAKVTGSQVTVEYLSDEGSNTGSLVLTLDPDGRGAQGRWRDGKRGEREIVLHRQAR